MYQDKRVVMVFLGLLFVAGFWAYQQFGVATLTLSSDPTGAIVNVDGRQIGRTPLTRREVTTGKHLVEILHSHYAPVTENVSLQRGDHFERHVTFQAGEGELILLSNPRGAWVEVDDRRLPNTTPTRLSTRSGERVIRMGREERHIVEETHVLNSAQSLEVNFNLNIDPHGSLTFSINPRNATVNFIGEDFSYSPKMRLPIGEYAIRISKAGYRAQEFRYQVRYGDNLHSVVLERAYGVLQVSSEPSTAELQVAYAQNGEVVRKTYTSGMRLPAGEVEVRARAMGFRTEFKKVRLTEAGAAIRFRLESMSVTPGKVVRDTLAEGGKGPEMVVLPAGSFRMGRNAGPPSEQPQHEIVLSQPFAVSRYEITVGEYLRYAHTENVAVHDKVKTANLRHPMAYITFQEAAAYADWLSKQTGQKYRLLSEAEWEYAAGAGASSTYFYGEEVERLCEFANLADKSTRKVFRDWDTVRCDDGQVRPGPVGSYAPNPFGLHDVYGNVSEWVLECGMPSYAKARADGSARSEGIGCSSHSHRGGSWDSTADELRTGYRNTARSANDDRGIRLLREL